MSAVVGIDVGAYKHAAAVCRSGEREAERGVLRLSADRSGFDELDRWLERQGPVERVVMESSGHYYWPLASHFHHHGYGWRLSIRCRLNTLPRAAYSGASRTPPTPAHWRHWV